ncbi:hypothetical protein BD770DRAFT_388259 [Pilaira anomala]|nr:hypothetical protein BD770DRAFT_388259 [Pilaira anomala]
MYVDLFSCLMVNRLWHDNSSRIIWRKACFEDTKDDLDTFLKFASALQGLPQLVSTPTTTNTYYPSRSSSISSVSSSDMIKTPIEYLDDSEYLISDKIISPESLFAEIEHRTTIQQTPTTTVAAAAAAAASASAASTTTLTTDDDDSSSSYFIDPRISSYRNALRVLSIRKIKEKSVNDPLSSIGQNATNLQHLDIYICDHFSNEALYPFLAHQSLTYLSLAGCHNISDQAILKVAEYCKRLEHLDLRACGLVSDLSLSAIALNCPRLRHLNVGRIRDRDKVSVKSIALIAQHTQAAVLGLAGCDVDDTCMQLLAKYRTTGLERVSVNSCFKISNQTVYAYIQYCPNLSVFEMKECHKVNDWEAVAELVERKVLLTLCDQQSRACSDWARLRGKTLDVKAPLK